MVIGIIGENCSGKSTLAAALQAALGAVLISGRDYLRLAKSPEQAKAVFSKQLAEAMEGKHLIYVIAEAEQIDLLPQGALKIAVQADLDTIKARFRERMRGQLPPPVEQMLERKHGMFENIAADFRFDGVSGDAAALAQAVAQKIEKQA